MSAAKPKLPYRRCVGVALFNAEGKVFLGERSRSDGDPERLEFRWQMPQGGIDRDEDPLDAAKRELYEETGVRSAALIEQAPEWYDYDFPPDVLARTRNGRYGGQTQLWFAFRFLGEDSEINLAAPGHKPEFHSWRWADLAELPGLIVPFKRGVYEQIAKAFAGIAK